MEITLNKPLSATLECAPADEIVFSINRESPKQRFTATVDQPTQALTEREEHPRRKLVLATAANLFLRTGYHGTSINKIVEESKIDKASIYYYFRDKVHIAHCLLESVIRFYEVNLLDLAHKPGPLKGHQLAVKFIDQLNALIDRGHVWLIFTHDFDLEDLPSLKPQISKISEQWANAISKFIKPVDYANMNETMTAHVSFELIIAAMRTKRRGEDTNSSKICLKRLLKSLWLGQ